MADLFRIDPPVVPSYVTCLRLRTDAWFNLLLRSPDNPDLWERVRIGSDGGIEPAPDDHGWDMKPLAAWGYGTLVEHPDPRHGPLLRLNNNPEERT